MEQTVNQAIMECKAGKNREGNLNWIIQKFQPVICKYAGKLYSLEYEDAVQELNEALIMAVVSIDVCNAEGQSIACWTMQLRRVRKIKKKRESFARLPEKRTR